MSKEQEEMELVEVITFVDENNNEVEFYVIEETRINGKDYILVADTIDEDEEAHAMILVDTSEEKDKQAVYEIVDDEEEIRSISKIFSELMEDADIEIED